MNRPTYQTIGNWYAASFELHHHKLAIGEIAARGLVPYLPIEPRRERGGHGRIRTVWRPMFGLYFFIRCLPTECGVAARLRGVRRLLTDVDRRPVCIDDGQIEVIRLIETEKAEAEGVRQHRAAAEALAKAGGRSGIIWDFAEGERVRIKNGPFARFYAELRTAVDVHDRLMAEVVMFGRKTVTELSAFEVERAG